jgi:PAS domain S-box-containing protein
MLAVEGTTHIIHYINKAFENLVGKDRKELIGRPLTEILPKGTCDKCIALLSRAYRTGEPEILLEQEQSQTPPTYWSYSVWAIIGMDDRPVGVMIQVTDATKIAAFRQKMVRMNEALIRSSIEQQKLGERLKQTVEELEKTKAELELRVQERTARLREKVEELRRSNDDLEKFAYISSHDLQEPLRMIRTYIGLLSDRYKDKLDEDARTFIGYAEEGATRMSQLIKDILDYSQINRQHQTLQPTDANAVVRESMRNLELTLRETQAQVIVDSLPVVSANKTQLMQVFQNLISNAIKFRKDTEPPKIHIVAERKEEQWLFSIRDNGIGFDARHHDLIFVAFKRLHANRDKYTGSGIGLALVKRIIECHGGKVYAESVPGEGTTIYFTLPDQDKGEEVRSTDRD